MSYLRALASDVQEHKSEDRLQEILVSHTLSDHSTVTTMRRLCINAGLMAREIPFKQAVKAEQKPNLKFKKKEI